MNPNIRRRTQAGRCNSADLSSIFFFPKSDTFSLFSVCEESNAEVMLVLFTLIVVLASLASSADETLFSVDLTLSQKLYPFVSDDAAFFFRDNKKRANPTIPNQDGVKQYLCVDEHKLDSDYDKFGYLKPQNHSCEDSCKIAENHSKLKFFPYYTKT